MVLLAVFVLPWLAPSKIAIIQSDSQAVGFNNRVAAVGLVAGVLAAFCLARSATRSATRPLIRLHAADETECVSSRVVLAAVVVSVIIVAVLGMLVQKRPLDDAAYFIDRLLRVAAGGVPYSQIEFSYGPLLICDLLVTYKLLSWTGMSVYAVYYVWVAAGYAVSLFITAYVLNRVDLGRRARNSALLGVGVFTLLMPTLGLNYSALRFLLPYAALLWALARVTQEPHPRFASASPALAFVVTAGVSPEMGVALAASLAVALGLLSRGGMREASRGLAGLSAAVIISGIGVALAGAGTFAAFAGGAFYFPVLPGAPALAFVGTMLLLAWGIASELDVYGAADASAQVGWLVLATVLVVPAFGRADIGHIFWNGLGAGLACAAVISRRDGRATAYLSAMGAIFLGFMLVVSSAFYLPRLVADARAIGKRPPSQVSDRQALTELTSLGRFCFVGSLAGDFGEGIARTGKLTPLYCWPTAALSSAQWHKLSRQVGLAETLVIPTQEYAWYLRVAQGARPNARGLVTSPPVSVGGGTYGVLLGFPLELDGKHPVLDPGATFGVLLQRDWVATETLGDYTLLRRR